ncbi:uncharacterized protein H6S33_008001 [Morchella sextelata]|uniref:uncharacterized protein n=1 Tax=Morchella sextelata TaxID=1174677 RepID=UPI001D04801D|nr:uncharacterized protein H6S33_008001 [Morchella sextelata]KAH0602997.1 hypothetical protein H6S33_008001 [Morchella sextelata]
MLPPPPRKGSRFRKTCSAVFGYAVVPSTEDTSRKHSKEQHLENSGGLGSSALVFYLRVSGVLVLGFGVGNIAQKTRSYKATRPSLKSEQDAAGQGLDNQIVWHCGAKRLDHLMDLHATSDNLCSWAVNNYARFKFPMSVTCLLAMQVLSAWSSDSWVWEYMHQCLEDAIKSLVDPQRLLVRSAQLSITSAIRFCYVTTWRVMSAYDCSISSAPYDGQNRTIYRSFFISLSNPNPASIIFFDKPTANGCGFGEDRSNCLTEIVFAV